jgi:mono/diheme cytochrome c family protein
MSESAMLQRSILAFLILLLGAAAAAAQGVDTRIWNGVFTAEQADRGKANFTTSCSRCHLADLSGGTAPSLKGPRFISAWENESLYRLFTKIRDTMPPNFGTALTDEAKLDVLTYILQVNAFPPGTEELKIDADELEGIQIVPKGAQTAEIPNFSLVQVVGCLTKGSGNTWTLTSTTDPVTTKDPFSTADSLRQAQAQALGKVTFRLVSVSGFKPEVHDGQKMEARGLLYREPNESRLNVTSLQSVASTCGNK